MECFIVVQTSRYVPRRDVQCVKRISKENSRQAVFFSSRHKWLSVKWQGLLGETDLVNDNGVMTFLVHINGKQTCQCNNLLQCKVFLDFLLRWLEVNDKLCNRLLLATQIVFFIRLIKNGSLYSAGINCPLFQPIIERGHCNIVFQCVFCAVDFRKQCINIALNIISYHILSLLLMFYKAFSMVKLYV